MHEHRAYSSSLSFIGHWPIGDKFQYVATNTIAPVMRGRAVIDYMAEVDAGAYATRFHPTHAVRIISMQGHGAFHGSKKLGHPVPLSNFVLPRKSVAR
jgi:hypothetical protein